MLGLYPGVILDVDGEMPELRALATYYARAGGALWVAQEAGAVIGMAATRPYTAAAAPGVAAGAAGQGGEPAPTWEICRVYVVPACHGTGLAHWLVATAEAHAFAAGAARLVLWSDTRFERAHRFYEKRGYVRTGAIRDLHDISRSREYRLRQAALHRRAGLDAGRQRLSSRRCCPQPA